MSFSKLLLEDAVAISTPKEMIVVSAASIGFEMGKGGLVKIVGAKISPEAQQLLLDALSIRPDYMMMELVKALSSKKKTDSWDLEKLPIEDIALMDTVREPVTLECGHTMNAETAKQSHNKCPICRHPIEKDIPISNTLLNLFTTTVTKKVSAPKAFLEDLEKKIKAFPMNVEEYLQKLQSLSKELGLLQTYQHLVIELDKAAKSHYKLERSQLTILEKLQELHKELDLKKSEKEEVFSTLNYLTEEKKQLLEDLKVNLNPEIQKEYQEALNVMKQLRLADLDATKEALESFPKLNFGEEETALRVHLISESIIKS